MVSHRRPYGRRALLPYEIDLCEQLGVTADEYWEFLFDAQEYLAERSKEYELVPDIRNEGVTLASIIVPLVLGLATSAIAMALAPKPKEPEQRRQRADLEIASQNGRTRYTRSSNFDGVQQLANLGQVIPLIFAEQQFETINGKQYTYGGIRVETDMLFSQMVSNGRNQLLYTILSLGLSKLQEKPDYDGLAIGDVLLRDYSPSKNRVFYASGERINSSHKYDRSKLWAYLDDENLSDREYAGDAFSIYWHAPNPVLSGWKPYFSGARTPSTTIEFGAFGPLPNGHRFMVPYEFVNRLDKSGSEAKYNADAKRAKMTTAFPSLCGISTQLSGNRYRYRMNEKNWEAPDRDQFYWADSQGYGDVVATQNQLRTSVDSAMKPNQRFLIGSTLATCLYQQNGGENPWDPLDTEENRRRNWILKIDDFREESEWVLPYVAGPNLDDPEKEKGGANPWIRDCVLQAAVGTLTNSRPCRATQIGIKSNVWRRLDGVALFNDHPTTTVIDDYNASQERNDDGDRVDMASIQLGTQTHYTKRYSFFRLYARELGTDRWNNITGTAPFAVRGTAPIDQYNTINIHPTTPGLSMHEYKFVPVPGSEFYTTLRNNPNGIPIKLLDGRLLDSVATAAHTYLFRGYYVTFTGEFTRLNVHQASNEEYIMSWDRQHTLGREDIHNETYVPWRTTDDQGEYLIKQHRTYFPLSAICDTFLNENESSSHASGPEHTIAFCNELINQEYAYGPNNGPINQETAVVPNYEDLELLGVKVTNSKEWTNFSNVTAYIAKGIEVERLVDHSDGKAKGCTNLFPEIAYALLTNPDIGGAYKNIGAAAVDRNAMATAARFCQANGFFFDGALSDPLNLRQFIFEYSAYMLCDFTIKGGKFALYPSVPFRSGGVINKDAQPDIKCLFTDGNVRGMEVSFLSPEERQNFTSVCVYREEKKNGFPETRSLVVKWNHNDSANAELGGQDEIDTFPVEEFDLTGFCTSQEHAYTFVRYAMMLRRYVDHGIKFETTPQAAMTLEPGDYFRFASKITHTERFKSGMIDSKGNIICSEPLQAGTYRILYWVPGTEGVRERDLVVRDDGTTRTSALFGVLWSVVTTTSQAKVYKCETLSYAEDGLVEVTGSFVPLTDNGRLKVLDWDDDTFLLDLA